MTKIFSYKVLGVNVFIAALIFVAIFAIGLGLYLEDKEANRVVITAKTIKGDKVLGEVIEGENNSGTKNKLSTKTKLVYQSRSINTNKSTSTAVVVSWSQQGDSGDHTGLEMRVRDGDKWSDWMYTSSDQDDRKDGTKPLNSGIILSKDISQVQYRLNLDKYSPEIDLSSIKLEAIDSSKGPSISKTTTWQKLAKAFGFADDTSARLKGPPIKSRAGWGSPEPYGSPRWTPSYQPVKRVIVHHTATTPNANSSAAVRAIWHYHANSRGWGDIGYNYLVDQSGNIFHGRYTNATYAEQNNVDVVGGHAYGNNLRTVGIAALGDFTNRTPSSASIRAIGEVAAFKGGPYGLNPGKGTRLVGHRDVRSTSCPGARLYARLSSIKSVANALYPRYYVPPYSWKYVKQYAYSDEDRQTQIDPNTTPLMSGSKVYMTVQARNVGAKRWYPDGAYPVRLATTNPRGRESGFCDIDTWINCGRLATISETSVAPGQVGNFRFSVVIPNNNSLTTDVTLKEYYSLVAENAVWLKDPGLFRSFVVPRQYKWQYISQAVHTDPERQSSIDLRTTPVSEGQTLYMTLRARNLGSKAWTPDGSNPIKLATTSPADRISIFCDNGSWLSCSEPATISESIVNSGDIGTFEFSLTVPANNTLANVTHTERFNIKSDGLTWLNDPGFYWDITIEP